MTASFTALLVGAGSTTTVGQVVQIVIAGAAALLALSGVWWQLKRQRHAASVERTIALHRDLTTGEVGAARDRFSEYMWRVGAAQSPKVCYQPTFLELLGPIYADADDATAAEWLHEYPPDIGSTSSATPLRDLYKVLWCFERLAAAWHAGLVDPDLFDKLLAHHAFWWDSLCALINDSDTRHRVALRQLASASAERVPDLRPWASRDFAHLAPADPAFPAR